MPDYEMQEKSAEECVQATIDGFYRDSGIEQLVKDRRAAKALDGEIGLHNIISG